MAAKRFVHDILGNLAQLELGLVNAEDEAELDCMLVSLELIRNETERCHTTHHHNFMRGS